MASILLRGSVVFVTACVASQKQIVSDTALVNDFACDNESKGGDNRVGRWSNMDTALGISGRGGLVRMSGLRGVRVNDDWHKADIPLDFGLPPF